MFCPNCGTKMEDGDVFCGSCGHKIEEAEVTEAAGATATVEEAAPVVEEVVEEAASAVEEVVEEAPVVTEEAVAQEVKEQVVESAPAQDTVDFEPQKSAEKAPSDKKPFPVVPAIIAGVAVLLVLVIAFNYKVVGNFFARTFSSPEKYYQYVEKQTAKDSAELAASTYSRMLIGAKFYDESVSGSVSFDLDEGGQDLLDLVSMSGVDLSWVDKGTVNFNMAMKDYVVSGDASLDLGKKTVLSGNGVVDLMEGLAYAQIPEINKSYLGLELDAWGMGDELDEALDAIDMLEQMYKAYPNDAKVRKLVDKYTMIAIKSVEDIDKSKKTLRVGNLSQKCTALEIVLDEDQIYNIAEAVLLEMEDDRDIEDIIYDIAEASDETAEYADDIYDEFIGSIEEALDELAYLSIDDPMYMTIYVDNKGVIRGRTLEADGNVISIAMPKKGSKFAFEALAEPEYGAAVGLTGTGKYSGNKINGDFAVEYQGADIVSIGVKGLNKNDWKKGCLNGTYTIEPGRAMNTALSMGGASGAAGYLSGAKAVINLKMTETSVKADVTVSSGKKSYGTFSASAEVGKGKKGALPAEKNVTYIDNAYDFLGWIQDCDWDGFFDKLNNAGVPSRLTRELQGALRDELDF